MIPIGRQEAAIWHCTLLGTVEEDKCYASKPEAIEHLKVNIHDVVAEMYSKKCKKFESWGQLRLKSVAKSTYLTV